MKMAIFISSMMLLHGNCFSQNVPLKADHLNNIGIISTINIFRPIASGYAFPSLGSGNKWDAGLFKDEVKQLFALNMKRELYSPIILDYRFVSQARPARYNSQQYIWVSTQTNCKSFGQEIASDVISSLVSPRGSKKHGLTFKSAGKGYYTPLGTKY